VRQNSLRQVLILIPLGIICACGTSQNHNSTASNSNTSAKANASLAIPYSEPPVPKGSNAIPNAIEVAQVLKRANIFPKENAVRERPLTETDKNEGVLTSVNIESSGVDGYTIKVYQSIDQRNRARLRMIKKCPGCNFIVECDAILMYEPISKDSEMNVIGNKHVRERYEVLKRYFGCG
jgi:hypothetical protein